MTTEELHELWEKHDNDFIRFDRVAVKLSNRPDLHAFLLRQITQQINAFCGVDSDERRAREIDYTRDLLRDPKRARLALRNAEDLQPGELTRNHQYREQQHRSPQQAAGK